MKLKKLLAGAMTTAMMLSMMSMSAFAATDTYGNGDYVGTIHMMNAAKPTNYSMCDGFFDNANAKVTVSDDATTITLDVVSPVLGAATLGETTATYNDATYTADIDSSYAAGKKAWPNSVAIGGVTAGTECTYQVLTLTLPADAVDALDDGITVAATVNAMGTAPEMLMKITNLTAEGSEEVPSDGENKSMDITAEVAAKSAAYDVEIPESVAMGTLKTDADTTRDFDVNVTASNLNGTITVKAAANGQLESGANKLAFTNSFGTQTVTADTTGKTLTGTLKVTGTDANAAVSGNYTGTTTFAISYAAN